MYGYAGKVLKVNLTDQKVIIKALEKNVTLDYIGGKGFGANVLIEDLSPT